MSCRQALLLSSSRCYGFSLLEFAKEEICTILQKCNTKELVFIPYAQNDFDGYTAKINDVIYMPQNSNHMGETRDERIKEFLEMPHADFVLGLREGAILHVDGNCLKLKGVAGAVLFKRRTVIFYQAHLNSMLSIEKANFLYAISVHKDGDDRHVTCLLLHRPDCSA
ncbi:Alpha-aspartyl dipeptidase [Eumeta japonica]|uniref:Alpha-aspartyl dipeptidase n=1 Tax=Eumeta variegata TaxID=151549 RepID=A0A4C1UXI3_EUMVA|nr:Alpha-aspartyl dipeptidase [Eumeta japonica]